MTGQVQGVGFRPFVYRLARAAGLSGTVHNDPTGVTVEIQGLVPALERFAEQLGAQAPALARVDDVVCLKEAGPAAEETGFRIVESDHAPAERGRVTVDSAVCEDCLREMRDPSDRRYRHALINCTNCGPRYTIVRDLPYDRPLTTMAPFAMCGPCEREYRDPGDRRFHAQPTCCPVCGPTLRLLDRAGGRVDGDPVQQAARMLREGAVLALKGLGGYHVAVDATSDEAVRRLRRGKQRDHKPFALMVADLERARELADLTPDAERALAGPERPIVLGQRKQGVQLAEGVAPGNHRLGLMLPYTPLQHLLLDEVPFPLVMTSANFSDDPLLKDDEEVRARLGAFCDAFLVHDRVIERAVDDSIVLDGSHGLVPFRRARGYVPAPLTLPVAAARPGLCTGADLKGAVALVRGNEVILSQHLGDLGFTLAHRRFVRTIHDLERLFEIRPTWIACDAHPDYLSRRWALEQATRESLPPPVLVQHHHAHLASLLAEHGRTDRILGLLCDGVGYGLDGTAWGGELLAGDLAAFERLGHLRLLRLPGGDAAARETGRCALSWLYDLLGEDALAHPIARKVLPDEARRRQIGALLGSNRHTPPTSSMGRLFDAAASLLGLCDFNHHEALSGMRLETAALRAPRRPAGDGLVAITAKDGLLEMDPRPLLDALLGMLERGENESQCAWLFHDALADGLCRASEEARARTGLQTVGMSGGVFCNGLLVRLLVERLEGRGFGVLLHRAVPPNDGGIALGQAAVAAALTCKLEGRSPSKA